jgi:hypothetical protein
VSAPLQHQTVLLREAVEALKIQSAGSYVDGTFGRGGHSLAILERLGPAGRLLAIDRDPQAVAAASAIADKRLLVRTSASAICSKPCDRGGISLWTRRRRGSARHRSVVAATRPGGARIQFPPRRAARHADGHDTGRDGGTVAPAGQRAGDHGGNQETMVKNGLLSRLQRRLWLLGESGLLQPRGSSPRLYARPCAPVSPARMRRRVPFKLYGFISIKSSSNSR